MNEVILNIYLIINKGLVVEFKAFTYQVEGGDDYKIDYLKKRAVEDFSRAYHFDAPSDKHGKFMSYNKFAKLEREEGNSSCSKKYSQALIYLRNR